MRDVARILFILFKATEVNSLVYNTPAEMVEFLVKRVGHEPGPES